jgi:endoglucanase
MAPALFMTLLLPACRPSEAEEAEPPTGAFLRQAGSQIVGPDGKPIQLKGVAFGNEVWSNKEVPNTHHTEADFVRVKEMNMNTIRFYLNYRTFENDAAPYQYKAAGWEWLDLNVAWAKKHGIYLIFNMHIPQGGFQSLGEGDALWNQPENQNRLVALWKAIAARYANEPQVAGYGLVNEPVPTQSLAQWQQLAQRLVNEMRQVNPNHLIFIEKPIYVKGQNQEDANFNFPVVSGSNLVYEYHYYDPIEYTHQLFGWANLGDGGSYPDPERLIGQVPELEWYTGTFDNPSLRTGNSDWTYLEGVKYKVTDPKMKVANATLVGAQVGGRVYFDDLVIKVYDPAGQFVKDVAVYSLDDLDQGWGYWSSNGSGRMGLANQGRSNGKSLYIEGATGDCSMSSWRNFFVPRPNYSYQISGWMRGENVAAGASCKLRIDFSNTSGQVLTRNRAGLEDRVQRYKKWADARQVPLYLGEFGLGIHCFQNNKGGLQWVSDMVDIALANQLPFTYHSYHEDGFGLYFGYGTLPDPNRVNQPLIDLLREKLR